MLRSVVLVAINTYGTQIMAWISCALLSTKQLVPSSGNGGDTDRMPVFDHTMTVRLHRQAPNHHPSRSELRGAIYWLLLHHTGPCAAWCVDVAGATMHALAGGSVTVCIHLRGGASAPSNDVSEVPTPQLLVQRA